MRKCFCRGSLFRDKSVLKRGLIVVLCFCSFSFSVNSQVFDPSFHVGFEIRLDERTRWQTEQDVSSEFRAHTFKLVLDGNITSRCTYMVKLRLNSTGGLRIDNLLPSTDYLYLSYLFSDKWKVIVGKQFVQMGTFEYYYSSYKRYFSTRFTSDASSYETGIGAFYQLNDRNEFDFQILNASKPLMCESNYNTAFQYIFLWKGNPVGFWKTRYGLSLNNRSNKEWLGGIAIGNQFECDRMVLDVDLANGYCYRPDPAGALGEVRDRSVAVQAQYKLGKSRKWIIAAKGIVEQRDEVQGELFKPNSLDWLYDRYTASAYVEYYPFDKRYINFHLAYGRTWEVHRDRGFDVENTLLAGLTYVFRAF